MIKLLPCPFCGGEAQLADGQYYEVYCRNCSAVGPHISTSASDAIAAWNSRIAMPDEGLPDEGGEYKWEH